MKKIFYVFLTITFIFFSAAIFYLSKYGLTTTKFNSIIVSELKKKEPNLEIELNEIKIKFDLEKLQIYLLTKNPQINYQNINLPIKEINIYTKIIPILFANIEVDQVALTIEELDLKKIQSLAVRAKPSNFKTYLLNNLNKGLLKKLTTTVSLDDKFNIKDFKLNGNLENLDIKLTNQYLVNDISLNFIADKNLILLNSINANYKNIKITNGLIDVNLSNGINLSGKFDSNFNLNNKDIVSIIDKENINLLKENNIFFNGKLFHDFKINFDESYKVQDYQYKANGNIDEAKITLSKKLDLFPFTKKFENFLFSKTKVDFALSDKKESVLKLEGSYATDENIFKKVKIENLYRKNSQKFIIDLDLAEEFNLEFLNFTSNKNSPGNLKSEFTISNDVINFKEIIFKEKNNSIIINNLLFKNNKIEQISDLSVNTYLGDIENNDFNIEFKDKITVKGKIYDSSNLLKIIKSDKKNNFFEKFNKDIVIDFERLLTKSEYPIKNFRLIGSIEKGKFVKISSKSEFADNNKYLDISLKKDPNNKKILEIYSDIPKAILTEYKFFEGLSDGKLFLNSIIDDNGSVSKLTVENFKLVKAPAFATLLTLADLGGIADVLTGEGISFDTLEINLEEDKNIVNIKEVLALGSSISLIMDGYSEKKSGLVSFSGTLVPAKTLNSLVSKIPVVGNILVGDKIGEGVFGVSFKMKGLPGQVKTTVNPVKTLTPRFITRALEKLKKTN